MQSKDNTHISGCTDPIFLLVLLGALGGVGFVTYWGNSNGNTKRMTYGVDSWDNICGYDNSQRKTVVDGFHCSTIEDSSTCYSEQGCKWRESFDICDPALDDKDMDSCSTVEVEANCYNDLVNSSNAGQYNMQPPSFHVL